MFNGNNLERIITAVIALLLIIGSLVITILASIHVAVPEVPQWLLSATTLVLGYYFGMHLAGLSNTGPTATGTGADVQKQQSINQATTTVQVPAGTAAAVLPLQAGQGQ